MKTKEYPFIKNTLNYLFLVALSLVATYLYSFRQDVYKYDGSSFDMVLLGMICFVLVGFWFGWLTSRIRMGSSLTILMSSTLILGVIWSFSIKNTLPLIFENELEIDITYRWINYFPSYVLEFLIATLPLVVSGWLVSTGVCIYRKPGDENKGHKNKGHKKYRFTQKDILSFLICFTVGLFATILGHAQNYPGLTGGHTYLVLASLGVYAFLGVSMFLLYQDKPKLTRLKMAAVLAVFISTIYFMLNLSHSFYPFLEWQFSIHFLLEFFVVVFTCVLSGWLLAFIFIWLNKQVSKIK